MLFRLSFVDRREHFPQRHKFACVLSTHYGYVYFVLNSFLCFLNLLVCLAFLSTFAYAKRTLF